MVSELAIPRPMEPRAPDTVDLSYKGKAKPIMPDKSPEVDRREFLTFVGNAVGGSAMLRAIAAMGIGTTLSGCGSAFSTTRRLACWYWKRQNRRYPGGWHCRHDSRP